MTTSSSTLPSDSASSSSAAAPAADSGAPVDARVTVLRVVESATQSFAAATVPPYAYYRDHAGSDRAPTHTVRGLGERLQGSDMSGTIGPCHMHR